MGLGIAAAQICARARGACGRGALVDKPPETSLAGQSEDVVDTVVLTPGHYLRPAVMACRTLLPRAKNISDHVALCSRYFNGGDILTRSLQTRVLSIL